MVTAVVFDMDGVIIDSEQVWDEVREELIADWGGRSRPEAQRAMMGMSSPEWSRYMHDELGLSQEPAEINDEVVRRMLERYHGDLPLLDGAVEAVRSLAASYPLAVASSSNRPLIDAVLETAGIAECFAATVSSEEVAAREAEPGRVSGGGAAARCSCCGLCCRRGLRERHSRRSRGRDGRDRVSEPALRAGCGGAWAGGCGGWGAGGAGGCGAGTEPRGEAEASPAPPDRQSS